ncbi:MAG: UDP-glucose 4-epimerase GalE [Chloroflexi bacterium]|nr:UDP-glucose 4-epimerase GalE [Chloroflexota bacterium]
MKTLITGGSGYIGSHMAVKLIEEGHEVVLFDNLSNSYLNSIDAIKEITKYKPLFIKGDIKSTLNLDDLFSKNSFDNVIHFAAYKAIGESVKYPLKYYENNILGSINLLKAMQKYGVKDLVFSSSASVYGEADKIPITEECIKNPTNPYGKSKLAFEEILEDIVTSENIFNVASLRYFNPIGAHETGILGESPIVPYNIMPVIADVLMGRKKSLEIFGNDYPTDDGTCVRDYLHVQDLVEGHLAALSYIKENKGISTFNLGTGVGTSVMELIRKFEEITYKKIDIEFSPRRMGDVPVLYTCPNKALKVLNWETKRSLNDMCEDTWRWLKNNPNGFNF